MKSKKMSGKRYVSKKPLITVDLPTISTIEALKRQPYEKTLRTEKSDPLIPLLALAFIISVFLNCFQSQMYVRERDRAAFNIRLNDYLRQRLVDKKTALVAMTDYAWKLEHSNEKWRKRYQEQLTKNQRNLIQATIIKK